MLSPYSAVRPVDTGDSEYRGTMIELERSNQSHLSLTHCHTQQPTGHSRCVTSSAMRVTSTNVHAPRNSPVIRPVQISYSTSNRRRCSTEPTSIGFLQKIPSLLHYSSRRQLGIIFDRLIRWGSIRNENVHGKMHKARSLRRIPRCEDACNFLFSGHSSSKAPGLI